MAVHDSSLGSQAFGDLADPGLIVAYQSHQDAMRYLAASLDEPNGVALLLGPKGAGKTTIINEQCAWSSRDAAVAIIDGIHLTPRRLVTDMLSQFGVPSTSHQDEQLLQQLSNFLATQTRTARAPVLIIDDADRASSSALRLLNWLAALDAGGKYALRIVLTGKNRLSALLRHDSMRSLARRHPPAYALNPLTAQETMIYLRTRLIAAGGKRSKKVFPFKICDNLRELSGGWPGRLNERAIEVMARMTELESARPVPRVIVSCDGEVMAEYELTERQYTIGRTELSDIVVQDRYVSKMHAMLVVYDNAVVLLDLNSTNGTTVNSAVTQKSVLRSGDIITLGHYRLKIENAPALSAEMDEQVRAADTVTMQNLSDLRRARARRTISALKNKQQH